MKKLLMLVAVVGGLTLFGTTGTVQAAPWYGGYNHGCAPVYGRTCAPVYRPVYGPVCAPVYRPACGNYGNCHVYGGGWGGYGRFGNTGYGGGFRW